MPNNPKAVIIGGCTSDGVTNDVWSLKLGQETLEWEKPKIGQPDSAPAPRWRHTATLLRASSPPYPFHPSPLPLPPSFPALPSHCAAPPRARKTLWLR